MVVVVVVVVVLVVVVQSVSSQSVSTGRRFEEGALADQLRFLI